MSIFSLNKTAALSTTRAPCFFFEVTSGRLTKRDRTHLHLCSKIGYIVFFHVACSELSASPFQRRWSPDLRQPCLCMFLWFLSHFPHFAFLDTFMSLVIETSFARVSVCVTCHRAQCNLKSFNLSQDRSVRVLDAFSARSERTKLRFSSFGRGIHQEVQNESAAVAGHGIIHDRS